MKSVFVNVFGGITACDAVANGIVAALELLERGEASPSRSSSGWTATTPRRAGASSAEANHPLVDQVDTMDGAASGPPSWHPSKGQDRQWQSS